MSRDPDGFLNGQHLQTSLLEPEDPGIMTIDTGESFFDGCADNNDAVAKMIKALAEPYSSSTRGIDAGFRLIFDALTLILVHQAKLELRRQGETSP